MLSFVLEIYSMGCMVATISRCDEQSVISRYEGGLMARDWFSFVSFTIHCS